MKKTTAAFSFICVVSILLNIFILKFNSIIPFSENYWGNHHYYTDERSSGGNFNLFRAWGQTDAQWYLKIAADGYGKNLEFDFSKDKLTGLGYAFFPFYPLIVRLFAAALNGNYELAAFILNNLLLLINWISIYYVVKKIYKEKAALIAATLVSVFPFSLFLRSYHAEGLYLLELTWWLFFLSRRKFYQASVFLALLNITKGTGWLLNFVHLYFLVKASRNRKTDKIRLVINSLIPFSTIILWIYYVYLQTGDPFFFFKAVNQWKLPDLPAIIYNILRFGLVGKYIVEGSWTNVLQTLVFVASVYLLFRSRKTLKPEWWWTSLLLLAVPTLTTYSVGFTSGRLAVIQLPLWVFLAVILTRKKAVLLIAVFVVLLFWGSLFFVNWYWWG